MPPFSPFGRRARKRARVVILCPCRHRARPPCPPPRAEDGPSPRDSLDLIRRFTRLPPPMRRRISDLLRALVPDA
jgi:hypothetical protein